MRTPAPLRRLPLAIAVALMALAVWSTAAWADAPPYTDPASTGRLTLCDTAGHSVTSGNIHTKPFVWRAVGSAPGTGPYRSEAGRTAALYGYQPKSDTPPDEWNGEYLTASSAYSNSALPMAGATAADPSLADLLSDYPPRWNGLVQLRMFLGAPRQATKTDTYNSATIRVSGDRWTLLDGGNAPCNSGTAQSAELVLPSVRALGTPAPNATTDAPVKPGAHRAAANGATTSPSGDSAQSAVAAGARSTASSRPTSTATLVGWVVAGVALACTGAAGIWWRLGRRAGPG